MYKHPSHPERVLVADADPGICKELKDHLTEMGCIVIGTAFDTESIFDMLRGVPCSLAIVDASLLWNVGDDSSLLPEDITTPVLLMMDDTGATGSLRQGCCGCMLKPFNAEAVRVAVAGGWHVAGELGNLRYEIEKLKARLEDRKVIEQAKWILVEQKQLSEPEAMRALQRHARSTRRTLIDVARAVIEGDEATTIADDRV
ncbi:MAG: ANTAR domain-containing response regulator [Phycisphaerales bacterium]